MYCAVHVSKSYLCAHIAGNHLKMEILCRYSRKLEAEKGTEVTGSPHLVETVQVRDATETSGTTDETGENLTLTTGLTLLATDLAADDENKGDDAQDEREELKAECEMLRHYCVYAFDYYL